MIFSRLLSSRGVLVPAWVGAPLGRGEIPSGYIPPMLPLESLIRDLNERGGRYVVVGGLAVVLHGHLRATGDIDLVVDLAPEQVDRTLAALEGAGFQPYLPVAPTHFADPAKRAVWVREQGMVVFSLRPRSGVPMVDLFLEHPMPFDQLWARSVVVNLRGVAVRIASIDDLIALKRQAGRPEDLTDAEALTEIKRLRAEQP